jgi:predicted RNase H-like nuclease (RuvC/YqgF family)
MAQSSKTGLIILIIFCVIFAALAGGLLFLQMQEKAKNSELSSQILQLQTAKNNLQKERDEIKNQIAGVQSELDSLKQEARQLEDEIGSEKSKRQAVEAKLKSKDSEITNLQSKINDYETNLSGLKNKYSGLEAENEELLNKLNQIRLAKKALEAKISSGNVISSDDEEEVELGTVIVKADEMISDGRVLVVNKEFNFIVIDLGEQNGVGVGTQFGVYRDGELLAKVEVEQVYKDMSSAKILAEDLNGEIQEDDEVKKL